MKYSYNDISEINGSLIVLEGVSGVSYDEIAYITCNNRKILGKVVAVEGDKAVVQVYEGTSGLSLTGVRTEFAGHPMQLPLSEEILGRVFDGSGNPKDGLGNIYARKKVNVNGSAINPVSREYPKNYIRTGFSAIDGMSSLIRGQKLPVFSGAGMNHNRFAAALASNSVVTDGDKFAIVFAAMGVKNDVAEYFRKTFEESGAISRVTMFLNLASDPIIERIITPRCALTAAEYLAFELGMHVLVIMTDMTSYCEALREFSSSKGEIPGRKGYPGYLYSNLASIYERAGMIKGRKGSITQVPILTMPNDDINHPIPDLTGYITEGQIVFDRELDSRGIFPPIAILPSLSRLMKDGIGEGYTREDHPEISSQLFASYSKVKDIRSLAQVIGEDELSPTDRLYIEFGKQFEEQFINQSDNEIRTIEQTLDLAWKLISLLPESELDRLDSGFIAKYYRGKK